MGSTRLQFLVEYSELCCFSVLRVKYQKEGDSAKSVEIKEVMDTWTLQMGYPVVTVRQTGNRISATQHRFLFNSDANYTEEFTSPYGSVLLCDTRSCAVACPHSMGGGVYWRLRAAERLGDPPARGDPGGFSGQRQGWKTPRGPSGSALLLCVAGVHCWFV